jgi:hypothetical protein
MKNKHPETTTNPLTQQEYITQFCSKYSIIDVKRELLKWLVLTNKAGGDLATHVRTDEFGTFYDELNKLVTAVYWVHYRAPSK